MAHGSEAHKATHRSPSPDATFASPDVPQGYLSPFTVRYHVPLGLGLGPEPGPGRAGLAAALLSQQEQHGQGQPQKEQRQQPSAGLPGVDRKVALAGPSPPAPGSPVPRLPSPAQAGLADPAVSALEAAVAAGVVRLDVPYIATLGPMQARNGTTGGAGVGLPPAPARDSGRPAGGLEDVGGAGDSQAAAAAVAGHSRAAVTERFGAPCWVPWAGGGGTHGARSVPIAQQQQAQQAGEPAVHCASATCAEEAGQQAGTGEGQGPPAKRHHAATEPLTSEHDSATANQGRIPAGAGAEDATSPGHLGGAVWWFAYGAAVGATAEQLGALRSVPAVLPGGFWLAPVATGWRGIACTSNPVQLRCDSAATRCVLYLRAMQCSEASAGSRGDCILTTGTPWYARDVPRSPGTCAPQAGDRLAN